MTSWSSRPVYEDMHRTTVSHSITAIKKLLFRTSRRTPRYKSQQLFILPILSVKLSNQKPPKTCISKARSLSSRLLSWRVPKLSMCSFCLLHACRASLTLGKIEAPALRRRNRDALPKLGVTRTRRLLLSSVKLSAHIRAKHPYCGMMVITALSALA